MLLPTLIRKLNAETNQRWRVRRVQGNRMIERHTWNYGKPTWVFEGWADDQRDVNRLAEDYGFTKRAA